MADTRSELKSIATEFIRRGGYNSFSFRDLAEKAGVKSSSVHYYFPTKSDLVEELANDYAAHFLDRLNAETAKAKSLSAKLLILAKLYEESLAKDLNCLCGTLANEIDLLSAKEQGAIKNFFDQLEKWLRVTLGSEKLRIDMDKNEVTYLIMSSLSGALVLDRAYEGKKRLSALKSFIQIAT